MTAQSLGERYAGCFVVMPLLCSPIARQCMGYSLAHGSGELGGLPPDQILETPGAKSSLSCYEEGIVK